MAAALVAAALGLGIAGCGGGDASGATVDVYVAAPLCAGAEGDLAGHGATAGHYEVAVRCLAPSGRAGAAVGGEGSAADRAGPGRAGLDLAALGSNSRRATEDTSSVVTLEPRGGANKFTRPILESAGVPLLTAPSGRTGMKQIFKAIESAGSSDVRASVREALEPS